jgi:hypothetical protein
VPSTLNYCYELVHSSSTGTGRDDDRAVESSTDTDGASPIWDSTSSIAAEIPLSIVVKY